MNVLFTMSYELAGQSIISNGCTTYCVVSYGSYPQPILYGLPSGAVAVAYGTYAFVCDTAPSVQGRRVPSVDSLLNSTLSANGTGCVGQLFTSGAVLTGTFTSGIGSSGLPVSRSRMNVMPSLFTKATAGRVFVTCFVTVFFTVRVTNLPFTLTRFLTLTTTLVGTLYLPSNMTPLFGRSESQRSWWATW